MSIVSLLGIKVLNNPAKFTDSYEFEITFECLEQLKDDLEWKLTYVGSSRSLEHDQELDSLLVGPIPIGINKFILTADAPSPELIPASELVSVTVILLSCSYKEREFVRVGYYVNNEYDSEELRENPPAKVQVDHIVRNILAEKPRVTRFNIAWDNEGELESYPPEQEDGYDEEGEEDEIVDMGLDGESEEEEHGETKEDEDEEDEQEANANIDSRQSSDIESAKRQNTINDDDIPEVKKQKLEKTAVEDVDAEGEDKEEDLDELEEADEEELEEEEEEELEEELEDETALDEEIEEEVENESREVTNDVAEEEGEEGEEEEEEEEEDDDDGDGDEGEGKEEVEEDGVDEAEEESGVANDENDNQAVAATTGKDQLQHSIQPLPTDDGSIGMSDSGTPDDGAQAETPKIDSSVSTPAEL